METVEGNFIESVIKEYSRRGVPISSSVLERDSYDSTQLHPLVNKVQLLHWSFWTAEEELQTMLDNVSELSEAELSELKIPEFMPQVDYSRYVEFKRQEARIRCTLLRKLHRSLTEQVIQSTE